MVTPSVRTHRRDGYVTFSFSRIIMRPHFYLNFKLSWGGASLNYSISSLKQTFEEKMEFLFFFTVSLVFYDLTWRVSDVNQFDVGDNVILTSWWWQFYVGDRIIKPPELVVLSWISSPVGHSSVQIYTTPLQTFFIRADFMNIFQLLSGCLATGLNFEICQISVFSEIETDLMVQYQETFHFF